MSGLAPMRAQTLADQCYGQLKDAIISLELRPGMPLSELQLARQFNVSKSPVREALQRLSGDGLVTLESNRRCRVTTLHLDDVRDWYELRLILEPASLGQIATTIDARTIERLRHINDLAIRACQQNDLHGFIHNSDGFHLGLIGLNPNRSLVRVVRDLFDKVRRVRVAMYQRDQLDAAHAFTRQGLDRHERIVGLLGEGRPDEAVAMLRFDLESFFNYFDNGDVSDALDRVAYEHDRATTTRATRQEAHFGFEQGIGHHTTGESE